PPREGAIVFVGGSSIRFWRTLADDMKPLEVVNRGFGGAQMPHVVFYASRIVIPYRPRGVVVYAGANDLGWPTRRQDATPETVLRDFQELVSLVHARLPDAWIYFISINPEPARWKQWPSMRQANQLVSRYAQTLEHVEYLDVSSRMLEADGKPRP